MMTAFSIITNGDLASIAQRVGTTEVWRDLNFGGNFLLKSVPSVQACIDVGGILILDRDSGVHMILIGETLRKWALTTNCTPSRLRYKLARRYSRKEGFAPSHDNVAFSHSELVNEGFWQPRSSGNFAFAAVFSTADAGVAHSNIGDPSLGGPFLWKYEFDSPLVATADFSALDGESNKETVDGWVYRINPNYQPTGVIPAFAFVVASVPFVESFKHLLLRMKPGLTEGGEGAKYSLRAFEQLFNPMPDWTPVIRTLWLWTATKTYHGPGFLRNPSLQDDPLTKTALGVRYNIDPATSSSTAAFNYVVYDIPNGAQFITPGYPVNPIYFDVEGNGAAVCRGLHLLAPARGNLALPTLFDFHIEALDLPGGGGPLNEYTSRGFTPLWDGNGQSPDVTRRVSLVNLPATGTVGQIDRMDVADVLRSSMLGVYMADDGSKKANYGLSTWEQFLIPPMPDATGTTLSVKGGLTEAQEHIAYEMLDAMPVRYEFEPPKLAWMLWGVDVFDQTQTFIKAQSELAEELARADN